MAMKKLLQTLKGRLVLLLKGYRYTCSVREAYRLAFLGPKYPDYQFQSHFNDLRYIFRWRDYYMVNEVLDQAEYAPAKDLLKGSKSPFILDLGSNIGTFSLYFFHHFPQARIHAYEASAATYAVLNQNKDMNPQLDWHIFHAAAWKEDGAISFENKAFSGGSFVSPNGKETVPALSLTTILASVPADSQVDLLKIDIEGAEEATLIGRDQELSRIKTLVIELHPHLCNTVAIAKMLRAHFGYLYALPNRQSSKPLLIASRQPLTYPLYHVEDQAASP
ncbi:MAG: FkbM family methyltransferase [Pseudomonadota bacterium]